MLRVLFVCTGNICRSPMAHGFLAQRSARLFDGAIQVRSAGTWARSGSSPVDDAVRSAAARGADIAGLRSTPFAPSLARWADLVVAMTAEQREEILEQAPEAAQKTFTLKGLVAVLESLPPPVARASRDSILDRVAAAAELRASGRAAAPVDEDVADPLGLPPGVFDDVASEIADLTDRLLHGLAVTDRSPVREA
ncbi:MAG TPA: low molecular weight phosphatase family protein [Actinomycetota bacterium]|nr:low molecular weight phosphatase family protein [Actinomycetota bacterium]